MYYRSHHHFFVGVPIFLLLIIAGILFIYNLNHDKTATVFIDDKEFKVELADTQQKRITGLSGRGSLSQDEGMFFVFDAEGFYSIWMKDMNFPIDVIWFDKNLKITHIEQDLSPASYPNTYRSSIPSKFVLEIGAGLAKKYNFNVGDSLKIYGSL